LTAVTVIVEVPAALALTVTVVGLAAMVKSWTTKVTVTECDREPLVPVTPTWTVDALVNVHDNVALPEPVILAGETLQAVLLVERPTAPMKPFSAVTVTVDVCDWPTLMGLGVVAVIEKSGLAGTVTATLAEWEREPLTPVTFTL